MDITTLYKNLKQRSLRLYPALVYCATNVVNRYSEFRYAYDNQGNIGTWDVIHPFYTVPRKSNRELFSMQCTPFSINFFAFYKAFVHDYAVAEECDKLVCAEKLPKNVCGVSIVPGTHFSAFSFSGDQKTDFTPSIVFGKFIFDHKRILLPVSGEFSHAVNDGVHISRFFDELERLTNSVLNSDIN